MAWNLQGVASSQAWSWFAETGQFACRADSKGAVSTWDLWSFLWHRGNPIWGCSIHTVCCTLSGHVHCTQCYSLPWMLFIAMVCRLYIREAVSGVSSISWLLFIVYCSGMSSAMWVLFVLYYSVQWHAGRTPEGESVPEMSDLSCGTEEAPFEAVLVFTDPIDWYRDLQLITDVIMSGELFDVSAISNVGQSNCLTDNCQPNLTIDRLQVPTTACCIKVAANTSCCSATAYQTSLCALPTHVQTSGFCLVPCNRKMKTAHQCKLWLHSWLLGCSTGV